jgi:hypothetical protein
MSKYFTRKRHKNEEDSNNNSITTPKHKQQQQLQLQQHSFHDEEKVKALLAAVVNDDWDAISLDDVEGADVAGTCARAANKDRLDGAVKLVAMATEKWRLSPSKLKSLDNAWTTTFAIAVCMPTMANVLDLLAHAEQGIKVSVFFFFNLF